MRSWSTRFLLASLALILMWSSSPAPADAASRVLTAPDGSTVTIGRDSFGVPHILADNGNAAVYAQGFAVAEDRLVQLNLHRRAATGRMALLLGPSWVAFDQDTRTAFFTEAERMTFFSQMSTELQGYYENYVAGINHYLDLMAADPIQYKPQDLIPGELPWTVADAVAVTQFMIRRFGQSGGEELDRLAELQANGQAWFDQNRPINDPSAPTTIPSTTKATTQTWTWSGQTVRPEAIEAYRQRRELVRQLEQEAGLPASFGSFAVLIRPDKSPDDSAMLLGAPQMGPPQLGETSLTHELELICPEFHVGGMTVAGIPLVIIGRTQHHAWSMTSGQSDNTDIFIETLRNNSLDEYFHDGQWLPFEVISDVVRDFIGTSYPFDIRRSVHGPVVGSDTAANQAFTMKTTLAGIELGMAATILDVIKAETFAEVEAALATMGPSFNFFYVDVDRNTAFWHLGKYQDRTNGVDPRLPHNGDGSEEWGGLRTFASLPHLMNPAQNYLVNWNNKPVSWWDNGDDVRWVGSHRVDQVEAYVGPLTPFSYAALKAVPGAINDVGTYQQAIQFGPGFERDENIVPPGQSAFRNVLGQLSPHVSDQWTMFVNGEFKDMIFGDISVPAVVFDLGARATDQGIQLQWDLQFAPAIEWLEVQRGIDAASMIRVARLDGNDAQATGSWIDSSPMRTGLSYRMVAYLDGGGFVASPTVQASLGVPARSELAGVSPNPFNPRTTIRVVLRDPAGAKVQLFDSRGRQVRSFDLSSRASGLLELEWDGRDDSGTPVVSGVYNVQLITSDGVDAQRVTLVK